MITPNDLTVELDRLGVAVSLRTLTDWRQKGLLPALKKKGLGQGKGRENYWPDKEVVPQAFLIKRLLDWNPNADDALITLWLGGYAVSNKRVKEIWIGHLQERKDRNKKQVDKLKNTLLEDKYPTRILTWLNRIKRKYSHRNQFDEAPHLIGLFSEQLELIYNPNFLFESNAISPLLIDLLQLDETKKVYQKVDEVIDFVKPALLAVFPIDAVIALISSTPIEELENSRILLKEINSILTKWIELISDDQPNHLITHSALLIMRFIGRFITICFIQLSRHELDEPFMESIKSISGFTNRLAKRDLIRIDEYQLQLSESGLKEREKLKTELAKIWSF